ncbi:hypothetical protein KFU94_57025 [Chloroflexi bacterium TSY]|nr:hypothetical protein [Chloroflexi bacterium TSY]
MKQYRNYGDVRQYSWCAYCGGDTKTREHVPSKVLLDKPYPKNLPIVSACESCNAGFSMDEEYIACWIEVARTQKYGSNCGTSHDRLQLSLFDQVPDPKSEKPATLALQQTTKNNPRMRQKIARILDRRPAIKSRIIDNSGQLKNVEAQRMRNVLTKLAKGHSLFELNEPRFTTPSYVNWAILSRSKFGDFQSRLQGFWSHLFRFRLQKTTYFISENRPNLTQKLDIDRQICIYVNCLARILSQNLKFGSTDTRRFRSGNYQQF